MKLIKDYLKSNNPLLGIDVKNILQLGGNIRSVDFSTTYLDTINAVSVETKKSIFKNGFESLSLGVDGISKSSYDDVLPVATHEIKNGKLFSVGGFHIIYTSTFEGLYHHCFAIGSKTEAENIFKKRFGKGYPEFFITKSNFHSFLSYKEEGEELVQTNNLFEWL